MPVYGGTEVLTLAKANEAQAVVQAWLQAYGADQAVMYEPGHEGPMYVLSLEGADEWAVTITQDESVQWPAGVFAEPVASWCLGLYPAT